MRWLRKPIRVRVVDNKVVVSHNSLCETTVAHKPYFALYADGKYIGLCKYIVATGRIEKIEFTGYDVIVHIKPI